MEFDRYIEFEKCYEKCRALIAVMNYYDVASGDRAALLGLLKEEYERLGEFIKEIHKR